MVFHDVLFSAYHYWAFCMVILDCSIITKLNLTSQERLSLGDEKKLTRDLDSLIQESKAVIQLSQLMKSITVDSAQSES